MNFMINKIIENKKQLDGPSKSGSGKNGHGNSGGAGHNSNSTNGNIDLERHNRRKPPQNDKGCCGVSSVSS